MTIDTIVGIDLGTFNSCVAVVEGGTPIVIANRGGYKVTPSMVAVTDSGKRLVGHIAKRQAVTNAENSVYASKRLIGRTYDSEQVQRSMQTCAYRIVEGPNGDARVQLGDRVYSLPEISAFILQEMKTIAEDYLGYPVEKAVVTVPAYFNDNQRQATKDAGMISGLDVIRIINEPTAAALAFGFGKHIDRTVAVYDLGGGTFDISILELSSTGVFKVVSTAGDTFLGGEDFDQRVIDWLVEGFLEENDIDLRLDRMALQRLKDAAERAKCELSGVVETEVNLPFIISNSRNEALHLQRRMTRTDLEGLTGDLIQKTVDISAVALEKAGFEKEDIEDVILVGGMTRMPKVQQALTEFFEREPCKGVHPDEVVALGAAVQGTVLYDDSDEMDMVLLDVTPHTLGIMIHGGFFEELIPQNTTVPTSRSKTFTTFRDDQTQVKILVLQGESRHAKENELLGEFILTGLREAAAAEVEVEVTFEINADGIVSVHAKDLDTGIEQSIQVTASSGLTDEELEQMIEDARDFAVTRKQDDEAEGIRQEAMSTIADIERLFPAVEEVVAGSDFGRDALTKARGIVDRCQGLLDAGDTDALKEELELLARQQRMFRGVVGQKD